MKILGKVSIFGKGDLIEGGLGKDVQHYQPLIFLIHYKVSENQKISFVFSQ